MINWISRLFTIIFFDTVLEKLVAFGIDCPFTQTNQTHSQESDPWKCFETGPTDFLTVNGNREDKEVCRCDKRGSEAISRQFYIPYWWFSGESNPSLPLSCLMLSYLRLLAGSVCRPCSGKRRPGIRLPWRDRMEVDLFGLYVLFSLFRPCGVTPEKFAFSMLSVQNA